MTYTAKVTLKFDSTWEYSAGIYDDEMVPEQHITIKVPSEDLNSLQLFRVWESFMQAMGHNELGIMKGACHLAFNDMRSEESMRKIADEYDLILSEDFAKEVNKLNDEIHQLKNEISQLKSKSTDNNVDQDNLLEEHSKNWENPWNGYVPGSQVALDRGCKCPVLDNEEMPDDKKWVNADCPIHGKKLETKWEMNLTPLKWDNDYKFVPAPPQNLDESN